MNRKILKPSGLLRAGSAAVDITPPLGTHLAGDGAGVHRPAKKILDPLMARSVVLECGGRKMAVVALDVICVTDRYTALIREAAQATMLARERRAVGIRAGRGSGSRASESFGAQPGGVDA